MGPIRTTRAAGWERSSLPVTRPACGCQPPLGKLNDCRWPLEMLGPHPTLVGFGPEPIPGREIRRFSVEVTAALSPRVPQRESIAARGTMAFVPRAVSTRGNLGLNTLEDGGKSVHSGQDLRRGGARS